jgi:hypothetical protein
LTTLEGEVVVVKVVNLELGDGTRTSRIRT